MPWDPQTFSFDQCSICHRPTTEFLVVRQGEVADEWLCPSCAGRYRAGMGNLDPNQVLASQSLRVSDDPLCPFHQGAQKDTCKLHRWGNRHHLAAIARRGLGRNVAAFPLPR